MKISTIRLPSFPSSIIDAQTYFSLFEPKFSDFSFFFFFLSFFLNSKRLKRLKSVRRFQSGEELNGKFKPIRCPCGQPSHKPGWWCLRLKFGVEWTERVTYTHTHTWPARLTQRRKSQGKVGQRPLAAASLPFWQILPPFRCGIGPWNLPFSFLSFNF